MFLCDVCLFELGLVFPSALWLFDIIWFCTVECEKFVWHIKQFSFYQMHCEFCSVSISYICIFTQDWIKYS